MRKLFQAIRQGDLDTVRALLEKNPDLIAATAKQPKKDLGQSPLQTALKSGHFAIADLLLDRGADVNFIEAEDCGSPWRAPVLHDAINAAVMCSRWNVHEEGGVKVFHTMEEADAAYEPLRRMIAMGADLNGVDSKGNSCLWRFCLQARQILPAYNHVSGTLGKNHILTPELESDLRRIISLLKEAGMDLGYVKPGDTLTAAECYRNEPIASFLTET